VLERSQRDRLVSREQAVFRGCAIAALVLFFPAIAGYAKILTEPLRLPAEPPKPPILTVEASLDRGETLQELLHRYSLDPATAPAVVDALRLHFNPRRIRPGQGIRMFIDPSENLLKGLELSVGKMFVRVRSTPDGWLAEGGESRFDTEARVVRGTLLRNLYQDGVSAGLTPAQIMDLADIFQFDIDFFSDIRRGDTFSIAFEELRYENGFSEAGRILAAEIDLSGSPLRAIYHSPAGGEGGYFDAEGRSVRRAFLRAPLNYRRISSTFSYNRRHPITRTVRPHLAVDYAAAQGTPVVAIGSGTVSFAGWRDGYGQMVEVSHPSGYSSRYAHFSRIAPQARKGKRVAQGEVVGYVGQTGHATGPHLHFEMLRGRDKVNFLALRIPPQHNLSGEERERFLQSLDDRLALLHGEGLQVARATP
jgi:murein DD-endopeptidase MepM/ murein hydrolase activator NlpD